MRLQAALRTSCAPSTNTTTMMATKTFWQRESVADVREVDGYDLPCSNDNLSMGLGPIASCDAIPPGLDDDVVAVASGVPRQQGR